MPKIEFLADMVEANGKTIRKNNRAKKHKIPLGTLVEITSKEDPDFAWIGVRMYVTAHGRDCDETPLYTLGPKEENEFHCVGGFAEENLIVIQSGDQPK